MTVVPIDRARPQRRLTPAQAHELAVEAGLRGTERELLKLLLRLGHRHQAITRRRARLAQDLAVTQRTIQRAVRALEGLGLIEVTRGDGRTMSTFVVNFAALNVELTPVETPVQPGESMSPQGSQDVSAGESECLPSGDEMSPLGGQNVSPLRARDTRGARASLDSYWKDSPLPQSSDSDGAHEDDSPTASGGAPSSQERCQHGRTAKQGCRRCGTDQRTAEKRQRAEQARADREAQLARQAARRTEAGVPPPANFRDLVAQAAQAREDNSR